MFSSVFLSVAADIVSFSFSLLPLEACFFFFLSITGYEKSDLSPRLSSVKIDDFSFWFLPLKIDWAPPSAPGTPL